MGQLICNNARKIKTKSKGQPGLHPDDLALNLRFTTQLSSRQNRWKKKKLIFSDAPGILRSTASTEVSDKAKLAGRTNVKEITISKRLLIALSMLRATSFLRKQIWHRNCFGPSRSWTNWTIRFFFFFFFFHFFFFFKHKCAYTQDGLKTAKLMLVYTSHRKTEMFLLEEFQ